MTAGGTAAPGEPSAPDPAGGRPGGPPARRGGSARRSRVVVLVSGAGTNLGALLEASGRPGWGAEVVGVVADRADAPALHRARAAGLPAEVVALRDHPDRAAWDVALTRAVTALEPDLVVLAGFMKLVGPAFLARLGGRVVNTHPALSPSFPGTRAPADALAYGVKVTGATVLLVDEGVDTGAVLAQVAVPVLEDDDVATLHERIKAAERPLLVDVVGRMARGGWTTSPDDPRKVHLP
ncbi:phosphoribosylglycinamide formyltransferase [uncultured Pseudokineococcus sp.]|uniref:phosphoribosylglycinamide formyltransferase n=1 Tax=uncultured Pseudokineococcus sp. TaxID=1642928 RepID=UPI00261AB14C|nr:phosphoribosylglycinamide formyltransferase [uncultured Pseudokineococcus sp.]